MSIFNFFNRICKSRSIHKNISKMMRKNEETPSGCVGAPIQNAEKMNIKKLQIEMMNDHINPKSRNIEFKKNSCEGLAKV